jgi:PCO_ADO
VLSLRMQSVFFIRHILLMCSFLGSLAWRLPIRAANRNNMRLLAGGFGQRKASSDKEGRNAIQRVYDSLSSITDIDESMRLSTNCPFIKDCLEAMNEVELKDLGIDLEYVQNAKESVCMDIVNSADFDIQLFIIPAGKQLPLHDHPNMVVLSKVVAGDLTVRSFSLDISNSASKESAQRAALVLSSTRSPTDAAWLLTPEVGNIHELKATKTTVVFDVLMPPYSEPERPCNFYKSVESDGGWLLENVLPPPNRLLPNTVPYRGLKPTLKEVKWGSMFRRSSPARK